MSLYGALFSGVSGLSAQSAAMGAISDNISNVNTIGYKDTKVNFQTLVTHQVSQSDYSPGGVQSKPRSNVDSQGLLQASSSTTDVAISGSGFFVVNSSSSPLTSGGGEFGYTRAGSFKVDKDGYLQNVSGWYLQGWPLANWDGTATAAHQTINGNDYMSAYKGTSGQYTYINNGVVDPTNMQSLNLNNIAGTAAATTSVRMGANLPSGVAVGTTEQTNVLEYDSLGNSHNVLMTWNKVAQNSWGVQATPPEGARTITLYDNGTSATTPQIFQTEGRLDFSSSPSTGVISMSINGNSWNFVVGAGTNGTPANTMYAVGNPNISSASQFAATMSTDVNQAYLTEYSGKQVTPVTTGAGGTFGNAGVITAGSAVLTVTGPTSAAGGTAIDISGLTLSGAASAIDQQYSTTGVHCYVNGTKLAYYSDKSGPCTITGTNDAGTAAAAFTGTGLTYASQVAGAGSLTFSNFDSANSVSVSGLTSVLNSSPYSYTPTLVGGVFAAGSSITVTGATGGPTAVAVAGMTLAQAAAAITGQFNTTGVACTVSGNSLVFIPKAGTVTLSGAGGAATLATTYKTSGTELLEQAFQSGSPDTFTLSKVSATVYSGTSSTTGTPPTTPALVFNGNGTPSAINVGSMAITWSNGSQDQTTKSSLTASPPISLFFGNLNQSDGMTQLSASNYSLTYMNQNGAKFGNFSGLSIGSDGIVTALFDNGVTRPIFQIPIATFVNPDGMQSLSGNVYVSSDFSGLPTLRVPGDAGSGQTNQSSLEASTVDIGTEFTTMIVTQRAYSAAAKIITTADSMLDDLINIKR